MKLFSFLLALAALLCSTLGDDESSSSTKPANIIFIMIDDLGRADIGAFGAEWATPHIDSFISQSVTLSHHYIGYVCSASRSQFLTGRYSYHMGYGELDVFDLGKAAGFIPRNAPTAAEYLRHFGGYATFALGKWQLGSSAESQLAVHRGFDRFWGFNGGMEEYNSKVREWTGDEDETFFDFYDGDQATEEASGEYSTDQYFSKTVGFIEEHLMDEEKGEEPFFAYLSLQAIHGPFTESLGAGTNEYEAECAVEYSEAFASWMNRKSVCGAMVGIDRQLGLFLENLQSNPMFVRRGLWENTLVVLTSDNGGSLDKGSCNYPLRGGKNTFHEGGQRVLAVVGGGLLPGAQRGKVLDGLASNVDWVPTMLSFAQLLPTHYKHVTLGDSDAESELPMVLDGYNLHEYIMGTEEDWVRDHLVFHIKPALKKPNMKWKHSDISDYTMDDMDEFALIFYDESGDLWKYMNVEISSNIIGDPITNAGFCEKESDVAYSHTDTDTSDVVYFGIFNLNKDLRETYNYESFENAPMGDHLQEVIEEKMNYYINADSSTGSESSKYLYGHFSCLLSKNDEMQQECFDAAETANAWVTFLDDDGIDQSILDICSRMSDDHTIYKLLTTPFEFPEIEDESNNKEEFLKYISDDTMNIKKANQRAPKTQSARTFEPNMVLDTESIWDTDNDHHMHNEDDKHGASERESDNEGFVKTAEAEALDGNRSVTGAVNAVIGMLVLALIIGIGCVVRSLREEAKAEPSYIQIP